MLKSPSPRRVRRRTTVVLAAVAVPVGLLAVTGSPANAYAPNGGAEVFHEKSALTGITTNALQSGFWGHEGPGRDQTTIFSLGADNGTGVASAANRAAALAKIGPDATIGNLRVAYVLTSADGSAEKPTVAPGTAVGQAFTWFAPLGVGTNISGDNSTSDYGTTLSTQAQYDAWFAAGQHPQVYDDNLVAHNGDLPGSPIAAAPLGKSILNTWPDGTKISEVLYVSAGLNAQNEDTVAVGPDGKAEVAWQQLQVNKLPADHSQDPVSGLPASYDTVRTSALWTDLSFGVQSVATTTTLNASPGSPHNNDGSNVTFTAHVVANSGSATPTGTVTFKDGVNTLGTGTLNASGDATFVTSTLPVGSHSITASYDGASGFGTSASAALPYQVNGVATATTTAISVNTLTATAFAPVSLTATVTPAGAAGTVNFHEGAHNLGSAPVSGGVASLTVSTLGAGAHTVVADFTPTDASAFGASTNTSQSFTLNAAAAASTDPQTIQAEIAPGTIVISTPYGPSNPLDVGTLLLNGTATQYSGAAEFDGIDITDSRAGNLPWTATAFAHNLSDGGTNAIDGQNVGLTGLVQLAGPSPTGVTLSDNPAATPAVEPGAAGSLGLGGSPHTFAQATHGLGAWQFKGTLTVNAPADTAAGTYTGTVDFTVS